MKYAELTERTMGSIYCEDHNFWYVGSAFRKDKKKLDVLIKMCKIAYPKYDINIFKWHGTHPYDICFRADKNKYLSNRIKMFKIYNNIANEIRSLMGILKIEYVTDGGPETTYE